MKFNRFILILTTLIISMQYMSLSPARADDQNNDFTTAIEISVGTVTAGNISLPDDIDYFKFTVSDPGVYVIYSRNSVNIRSDLYTSTYSFIDSDAYGGEGDNFRLERTLNPGTYYLKVSSYDSATGNYEIWIEGPGTPLVTDDHGYSWHSATEISVGTVTAGNLSLSDDIDYFKFTVSDPGVYVIYSRNSINIRSDLYTSTYSFIDSDAYGGEDDNFRLERTLNPGTYYLKVSSYDSATGNYEIWIEGPGTPLVTDDHGYSWHSATEISVGTVTAGNLSLSDDIDYFKFTVSDPGVYVIYSRNSINIRSDLYTSTYSFIDSDAYGGEDDNFRLERTLNPGTYYLKVSSYDSAMGNYEIWIEGPGSPLVTDDHGYSWYSATEISVGTVTAGNLSLADDIDYFKFTVSDPGVYVIYSRNSVNIRSDLYTSTYSFIDSDAYGGEDDNFRLERTLNPGTYYLKVSSYDSATGNYEIWIEGPGAPLVTDDHGYSWHSATEISVGTVTAGNLSLSDDIDYFKFTVSDPGVYVIYSRNSVNIRSDLYTSTYSFIDSDAYGGEGYNFRLERTLNPGTYFLKVSSYDSATGNYEIWIEGPGAPLVTDDHGYSWHSATEISVGTVTPGNISLYDDIDYFKFTVSDPGVYVIYSRNSIDIRSELYTSDYSFIDSDTHGGEGYNFRLERTLNPGTYFLKVSSYDSATGYYELYLENAALPIQEQDTLAVRMFNVDDLAVLTINGMPVYQAEWGYLGTGTDMQYIGHQPGDSAWIDVTKHLIPGKNALRFTLYNEPVCCNASIGIEIMKNGHLLYEDSLDVQDSTAGLKYDRTFVINQGPSISQTPMAGAPGTMFVQSGQGFAPNHIITLHFMNHLGEELPSSQVTTDSSGAFSLNYTSPQDKPQGTHFWWAQDPETKETTGKLGYWISSDMSQENPVSTGTLPGGLTIPDPNPDTSFGSLIRFPNNHTFDPSKDTFVIIHGWNKNNNLMLPGWVYNMGLDIQRDSFAAGANVYLWNWQDKAVSNEFINGDLSVDGCINFPKVPYDLTQDSGTHMIRELSKIIEAYTDDYTGNIHFIGHSLGSLVAIYATKAAHKNDLSFKDKINHLTFLDSPCHIGTPADGFLKELKASINPDVFIDNYWSALGRFRGYPEADVNVFLIKAPKPSQLMAAHGYSHKWYRSSASGFSNPSLLDDQTVPDPWDVPWGFHWHSWANQNLASPYYVQTPSQPHWFLKSYEGYPEMVGGSLEDSAVYTGEITKKALTSMLDYARRSGQKVALLAVNTFNAIEDTLGYVAVDVSNHVFHELTSCNSVMCGVLLLKHHSTSVVSATVAVPETANGMSLGFAFRYAEPGTIFEVFMDDILVFHAYSHKAIDEGYQMIPWIDVSQYSGKNLNLTFRLSNPVPDTKGALIVDDVVFAKIEAPASGDFDRDGDIDGQDLVILAQESGLTGCTGECQADIIRDGSVDETDLSVFAARFGRNVD